MYEVQGQQFSSYMSAIDSAKKVGAEVFEVQADGTKMRRWAPAAAISPEKVRAYNERMAAYAAQEAQKNAR